MSSGHSTNLRVCHLPKRTGFSLAELLVAMAILSVIALMMASISNQAGRAWLKGLGQNERRSNGRLILEYVARDLKAAMLPVKSLSTSPSIPSPASLQFIASMTTAQNGTTNPTVINGGYMYPCAIFWQAPVARDKTYGQVAEVGYFVNWDTTTKPGRALPQMCRLLVDPAPINPATGNSTSANYLIYNIINGNPVNWLGLNTATPKVSVLTAMAPATAPAYQGWFADNVAAFWVRCLDSYGQPITLNAAGSHFSVNYTLTNGLDTYAFDSRQGYTDSANVVHPAPALPAAVDLAIVTIDSVTAARLTASIPISIKNGPANMLGNSASQGSIDYFMKNLSTKIKPGAQLFFTTVIIPSK